VRAAASASRRVSVLRATACVHALPWLFPVRPLLPRLRLLAAASARRPGLSPKMRPPRTVAPPPSPSRSSRDREKKRRKRSRAEQRVQIVQWQPCNAKRGQSTAGQPGTHYFARRVRWRGAERHVASCLAPCSPGARHGPWSSHLSSRLMSSTCVNDPGGLDATRPALLPLPLIIDEDSMLRLRAVASPACIAFRAQLRGSVRPARPCCTAAAILTCSTARSAVTWSLSISFAVARCHGIHGRARCSDGDDQDRRGAAAETCRPVGANASLRQIR